MERFTITTRVDEQSKQLGEQVKERLLHLGWMYDEQSPEILISVGGDGTMLHAVHQRIDMIDQVLFVGIHTGTLGFLTDYAVSEVDQLIEDLTTKSPKIDQVFLIQINRKNHRDLPPLFALNEARVENIIKTQRIEVFLNDEYLETFRGNGLCISGQLGSTAYNRSIAGAVIMPDFAALQMTEIAGIHHQLSKSLGSPLIVSPDTKIKLKSDSYYDTILAYDHLHVRLDGINEVTCSRSDKCVKFARYRKTSYIQRLHSLY